PPKDYYARVQQVLRANDILFVADEVICGFGRLGANTGSQKLQIQPDMMVVAKGITSGYVPLSGCVVSQPLYEIIETAASALGNFAHGYTYSAHPLAAAAALANLDIIEQDGLVANAGLLGDYLADKLASELAAHPLVGAVRSLGFIGAVELSASKTQYRAFDPSATVARRVYNKALELGLISRALQESNVLAISPPLVCTTGDVDEI